MINLRKIVGVAVLLLMAIVALAGCKTSTYAVMTTSEGTKNPEGDLFDPKVPWYETQEPVRRPTWTKNINSVQPDKKSDREHVIFIESVGEDKGPRSYYAAINGIEDKVRTDVLDYIRRTEEQKAKKEKSTSSAQLENRIQTLYDTAIRATSIRNLYWELHRFPENLKATNTQAEWYYLVWAEYSLPIEALEPQAENSDKTDSDQDELKSCQKRIKDLETYFSGVDHLISAHSEFLVYLKEFNSLLDVGFTLEKLTTLTEDSEYKTLCDKTDTLAKAYDPTETLRLFTQEQISFIQANLPKLETLPPAPVKPNPEIPTPPIPDPTPEEKLASIMKNLDTLKTYFKDVDDQKINPIAADQFRIYSENYNDLIEIETSLKVLNTLENNADWKKACSTTADMVLKYNPFRIAITDLTDEYSRMLTSEKKLSEYMDTIWNWKLPTRSERAKAPVYITKKGDTLVKIARNQLGLGLYWYWLWRCNYDPKNSILVNPDDLPPGTKLIIVPAREPLSPAYSVPQ